MIRIEFEFPFQKEEDARDADISWGMGPGGSEGMDASCSDQEDEKGEKHENP